MSAVRRQIEANQRRHGMQRRQLYDNYNNYYQSYEHRDTYRPRPASVCSFYDVTDNSDDDSALCVQRVTVGPY